MVVCLGDMVWNRVTGEEAFIVKMAEPGKRVRIGCYSCVPSPGDVVLLFRGLMLPANPLALHKTFTRIPPPDSIMRDPESGLACDWRKQLMAEPYQ